MIFKRYTLFVILFLFLASFCSESFAEKKKKLTEDKKAIIDFKLQEGNRKNYKHGNYEEAIKVLGSERKYIFHIPPFKKKKEYPLIIVLHASYSNARKMQLELNFDDFANEHGFLVAYPQAYERATWNDGRKTLESYELKIDDIRFIHKMIDDISKKITVDRKRIYAAGESNGGIMAYRLACQASETFAAVASVSGNLAKSIYGKCKLKNPISILTVNGDQDMVIPLEGGEVCGKLNIGCSKGFVHSREKSLKKFIKYNKCSKIPVSKSIPAKFNDGTRAEMLNYQDCKKNTEVISYIVRGMSHVWPPLDISLKIPGKTSANLDTTKVIFDFFNRH